MPAYRIPTRVAHVVPDTEPDLPEALFLMKLPDGPPQVLHGSAAWIWLLAAEGEDDVATAVAHLTGRERDEVAADVESFLAELVSRGLLALGASPA